MAPQLRPEKFGDVPRGLTPHHAEFLRKLRDAVEILVGAQRSKMDTGAIPGSQAVTFDDLASQTSDTDAELMAAMQGAGADQEGRSSDIERKALFDQYPRDYAALLDDIEARLSMIQACRDYQADIEALELKALMEPAPNPTWENRIKELETGVFSSGMFSYRGTVDDDATFELPTITNAAHGFVQVSAAGVIEQSAEFEIDSTGNTALIRGTAAVVVNADTDTKFCLGTAAAQNPMTVKNRLGAVKAVLFNIWYH